MDIREYTEYREDEIRCLYGAVGWTAYTENLHALEEGFRRALLVLAAWENHELLGIVRAVGDGATIVYVQDVLVRPDRQRQGIGTALLRAVLDRYADVRQIVLVTDSTAQTAAFYRSLGFAELSELGCSGFMRSMPKGC
ncbi:MAG: GNAT family N-acetyltransferase [Clostridia bacterium]|nr:GNAT family N-acetyltransferase [Clostridia bacterium]